MSEIFEQKLSLRRLEKNVPLNLADLRLWHLATSYLDEGQVAATIATLGRIKHASRAVTTLIGQLLFVRGLILAYDLNFTEALALMIRIKVVEDIEHMEPLYKDLQKTIQNIKIQKSQADSFIDNLKDEKIINFQEKVMDLIYLYLDLSETLISS